MSKEPAMQSPVNQSPLNRSILRVVRDFGLGLVLFLTGVVALSGDQGTAFARPGTQMVQAHTLIAIQPSPFTPDIVPTRASATAKTAGLDTVSTSATANPHHPFNIALLALMMAALTALNLALLRPLRSAYALK
jgi:hypothetical protein